MDNESTNLSARLRSALKILGVSQTELALRIGVKPQIIQYLCSGKSERSKFTFDIADALKVDVLWLATGKGSPPLHKNHTQDKVIPLLTLSQVKEYKLKKILNVYENITQWVPIADNISADSFALTLNDNSMSPRFNTETIIIIDPKHELNNHAAFQFVLAYIASEDYIVFRQLELKNNNPTLIPLNKTLYKNIRLTEEDVILGLCKEARWNI